MPLGVDYTKLLAEFDYNAPSGLAKRSRVTVGWVKEDEFTTLTNKPSGTYQYMAGCDLSSIFMPYQAVSGMADVRMPYIRNVTRSSSDISANDLLPFYFDPTASGLTDVLQNASGSYTPFLDSSKEIITGVRYNQSPADVRDTRNLRSIGLRLPLIATGWGFSTTGTPVPAGSGTGKFAGEVSHGSQVDPLSYVSGPVDLRFDETRGVWTTVGGTLTRHTHLTASQGGAAFAAFFFDDIQDAINHNASAIIPGLSELGS